jgi:hypothetical protein
MTIVYDTELADFFVEKMRGLLQKHCGRDYDLSFVFLPEKYPKFTLRLWYQSEEVSHIELELDFEPEIYMHSITKKKYEGKHYNTFLRAVIIMIASLLRFSQQGSPPTKYTRLGSNPSNWISIWLLYSYFGFSVENEDPDKPFWDALLPLPIPSGKADRDRIKKNLRDQLSKKKGFPMWVLDLETLPFRQYCELCKTLLQHIDC